MFYQYQATVDGYPIYGRANWLKSIKQMCETLNAWANVYVDGQYVGLMTPKGHLI